jgi:hypothetical protein
LAATTAGLRRSYCALRDEFRRSPKIPQNAVHAAMYLMKNGEVPTFM